MDAAEGARKVFVSVDMEGIAGVVTSDQLGPPGFEYERFRQFAREHEADDDPEAFDRKFRKIVQL